MDGLILAIDQGTTNSKAVLVDQAGQIVARGSAAVDIAYPQPGWVEQDPHAIAASVFAAVEASRAGLPDAPIVAVAVTNQRESGLVWERATGAPLGPCITWQCRRTAPFCHELAARGLEPLLHARSGLTIDPLFSASKWRWLLDAIPNGMARAAAGELCVGTVDSWVLWQLSGGARHACDLSNAARTQLLNLQTQTWDPDLAELFGIPLAALPAILPSSAVYGETVARGALPGGVPIAGLIGDSHAALFGHAGFRPGAIKATYGTGSSLMTPTPAPVLSRLGLSTTVAWATPRGAVFALEGNISVTGAAVAWLSNLLERDVDTLQAMAAGLDDNAGVYLVPAFVGLGAPHWREEARGLISGLTRGASAAHLARATLESIAYQVRDVFDALQAEVGRPLSLLLADGGASQNDWLMQFQADILDTPVLRSASPDVSALGAAYLAGLAVGVWPDEDAIAVLPRPHDRFDPRMDASTRGRLYAGWQAAVARAVLDPSAV